ncbi:154d1150-0ed4-4b5a-833e-e3468e5d1e05 [Thermothielavioides terrestris]|jgi:hypothetical protein|uniref:154d1150-0ed4-4b5a-833e-e3468e5d1e05 n=1 Tax=Thermothielavioides terrestris TaxID=2587410 RepID=A0A446BNL4_9PEZI|nr:154d1150-0ed4-4b5a-833e-e3468e5d1e05 [Thermothielavioides terrestris]
MASNAPSHDSAAPRSATSGDRPKKRRLREVFEQRLRETDDLATCHQESQADPSQLTLDLQGKRLVSIPETRVAYQYRHNDISFLETPDQEINWYAHDPQRPPKMAAYCLKGDADDKSINALARTIAHLCKKHNAPIWNAKLELEPPAVRNRHVAQIDKMNRDAQIAKENRRVGSQALLGAAGGQNLDNAGAPATPATPAEDPVTCAHCRKPGHEVAHCAIPDELYGSIRACPECNTKDHTLDDCPVLAGGKLKDPVFLTKLLTLVLTQRGNKPQFDTKKWAFYDVLDIAVGLGVVHDTSQVFTWPWSNAFARAMNAVKADGALLGAQKHPRMFNTGADKLSDLPVDPLFAGKTVAQVLEMRAAGTLDSDRVS